MIYILFILLFSSIQLFDNFNNLIKFTIYFLKIIASFSLDIATLKVFVSKLYISLPDTIIKNASFYQK